MFIKAYVNKNKCKKIPKCINICTVNIFEKKVKGLE